VKMRSVGREGVGAWRCGVWGEGCEMLGCGAGAVLRRVGWVWGVGRNGVGVRGHGTVGRLAWDVGVLAKP
jgi:hypothetical protein